ncbi:hypothetical protein NDU88_006668 [Pleurodeles waltl]|uniref:Uncharacterized protein n=1 Tax=Pleurodeles waltl TaxID=8319 RepID=A0AAV7MZX9_PLEWA|nr:hypothetical protein NDU88_006668 [Pleurodeles waltl]
MRRKATGISVGPDAQSLPCSDHKAGHRSGLSNHGTHQRCNAVPVHPPARGPEACFRPQGPYLPRRAARCVLPINWALCAAPHHCRMRPALWPQPGLSTERDIPIGSQGGPRQSEGAPGLCHARQAPPRTASLLYAAGSSTRRPASGPAHHHPAQRSRRTG